LIIEGTFYSASLRLKEGEVTACAKLPWNAKSRIAPIFVAAPPSDRDPKKRRPLTNDELIIENGIRIAKAWGAASCMLDPRYLELRFGRENCDDWMPAIFREARLSGARPGVVVNLADANGQMLGAYAKALKEAQTYPAIRLTLNDMQLPELYVLLSAVLGALGCVPADTVLILDFGSASIGDVSIAADVIVAAFDRVGSYGRWHRVIASMTSYPEVNPAEQGELILLPRTETAIWRHVLNSEHIDRATAIMGDFGPDSSKFVFKAGGVAPIPHYRYSTPDKWLVVRGTRTGDQAHNVRAIAQKLVDHELFMGPDFSFGDWYYAQSARGRVVGSPTEWRAANVNHHLQFIVRHLALELGLELQASPQQPEQADLLDLLERS
jgi:hypothetical protein